MSEKKGFFKKAFDDMKENAKKQHEIDAYNFNGIKEDSKKRFEDAKNFKSEDMQEFKDAKGIKEKTGVVLSHMEIDSKKITEETQENYKNMLEEQRKNMNKTINENKF